MIAYKLFRTRKDGSISSLFINKSSILPIGSWIVAKEHPTSGFTIRKGWHALPAPNAPHLSKKGRTWYKVKLSGVTRVTRPISQGGAWLLASHMKILHPIKEYINENI